LTPLRGNGHRSRSLLTLTRSSCHSDDARTCLDQVCPENINSQKERIEREYIYTLVKTRLDTPLNKGIQILFNIKKKTKRDKFVKHTPSDPQ
jgi:hypothetical protein